jgi:cell wall-associated NlpC family hydrolase
MTNGLRIAMGPCLTWDLMTTPRRSFRSVVRLRTLAVALGLATVAGLIVQPVGANELSDKRAEAAVIASRLAELDGAMMDVNARFEAANYKLSQAEAAVAEARRMATETKAEMDKRAEELRGFAVKAYMGGTEGPAADALLTDDASAGVISTTYMSSLSGNRQDYVDALNAARSKAEEDAARLAQAEAEAKASADEIEVARNQAKAQRDEQAALNARVQGEVAELVRREQETIRAAAAAAAAARRSASVGTSPRGSSQVSVNVPPANGSVANAAIRAGLTKVGSPYVWAASGPSAFDCSGFTQWAFGQAGVRLPHYSGAQYAMTTRISASQLQPGDLVFWGGSGSAHVAIYMGNNQLVHAFGSGGVDVTELDGWWMPPSGYGRLNL